MNHNKKILLSHPGSVQVTYQFALALQEQKKDFVFHTSIYYIENTLVKFLIKILPKKISTKFKIRISQRQIPNLNRKFIFIHPAFELSYLLISRIRLLKNFSEKVMRLRNIYFDKKITYILKKEYFDVVVGYDSCIYETFLYAKSKNKVCVLDQVIGHFKSGQKILTQEASDNPEFADSFTLNFNKNLIKRQENEIKLASWILLPSKYVMKTFIDNKVDPKKLLLCPYGVDTDKFYPSTKKITKNEFFEVLFVGQISQRKGIKYLFDAIQDLKNSKIKLTIIGKIIGSGSWLAKYNFSFTHINFVPYNLLPSYYQNADIFVFPSLHEGSALAIYEALACGLPVITTFNSGSIVRDKKDGFIIPIKDSNSIQNKINLLMHNPLLRDQLSKNARKQAEEFSWKNYRKRLINLLHTRNIL